MYPAPEISGIWIDVLDNGGGIAEGDTKRIFGPLYAAKILGIGLGLPWVEKIMQRRDGDLSIERMVGQGSTVSVHFPIDSEAKS